MNKEIKQTFNILIRHLLIGASVTILIFWLINEIPNSDYLLARLHIWLTIPIVLTLAALLSSKLIYIQLTRQNRNRFLIAFGFIFFSWTVAFLSTAISEGIFWTIINRRFEIFDTIVGYGIYQLWFYWLSGLIHGLTGGLFLAMDFNAKHDKLCLGDNLSSFAGCDKGPSELNFL
ncbi:MAG TPA: hypothetical protein VK169_01160 [Saprospiraceae bacterium]|nr:hypothetical protein [Saprospiraceae bacterium]